MSYFGFHPPNPIVAFSSVLRGVPILGLILVLGPFLPSVALAQRGGEAAFAIRVTDEEGAPIAGAQVLAQPSEAGPAGAPPAVTTDELGQAVVAGLTEGEWFVEVSHPAYMLFAAYIELRSGKKPQVGFSSQVNTDTSWKPMTVKFLKASPEARRGATTQRPAQTPPPEVVRPPAKEPVEEPEPPRVVRPERPDEADREAAATESGESVTAEAIAEDEGGRAARETPTETPAEEPAEAAAEAQEVPAPAPSEAATTTTEAEVADARVVTTEPSPSTPEEAPSAESEGPESDRSGSGRAPGKPAEEPGAVEPEPAVKPRTPPVEPTAGDPLPGQPVRPEDVESPPPEVAELPAVEESSAVPPGLEVEAEARAAPSEPEPSPSPAAEPADASPTGAVGRVPRFLRSGAAGTCSECEPGEWAVAAEQEAARAGESRREQQCSQAFVDGAAEAARLLADSNAPRLETYAGPLLTAMWRLESEGRDAVEELLGPRTDPASHCQLAGAVLPAGAEFTGYVIEAWDVLGGRACLAGFDCAVGQARWLGEPEVVVGDERTVVYGIFKNRSTRRERRARLTIYFRPPSDDWMPAMR